jgi:cytoskeletal protein CcmA (bactofilin family)
MFSKPSNKTPVSGKPTEKPMASAPSSKSTVPSIISASLHVVGNLVSEGDIQIDGAVDGDIRTTIVTIGNSAEVKGEVVAESVTVHGRVEGTIRARTVILGKTARIDGDIYQETLAIEAGAHFEGNCRKLSKQQPAVATGPRPVDNIEKLNGSGGEQRAAV